MKKSEVIKELASEIEVSQNKAREMVNAVIEIITKYLSLGEKVNLDGLGCFYTANYDRHNIKAVDGSSMCLEPRLSPRFKASKKLKNAVKEPKPK